MPVWPESLPQVPLLGGYDETPPALTLRTDMDAGPAKVRRRFTAGVRQYGMAFLLTAAQLGTLDTFFMDDLEGGALSFDFPAPRGGGTIAVRFVEPPAYTPAQSADTWRVAVQLEQLP